MAVHSRLIAVDMMTPRIHPLAIQHRFLFLLLLVVLLLLPPPPFGDMRPLAQNRNVRACIGFVDIDGDIQAVGVGWDVNMYNDEGNDGQAVDIRQKGSILDILLVSEAVAVSVVLLEVAAAALGSMALTVALAVQPVSVSVFLAQVSLALVLGASMALDLVSPVMVKVSFSSLLDSPSLPVSPHRNHSRKKVEKHIKIQGTFATKITHHITIHTNHIVRVPLAPYNFDKSIGIEIIH